MRKLTIIMVLVLALTSYMSMTAFAENPTQPGINWGEDNFEGSISCNPVKSDLSSIGSMVDATHNISSDGFFYFKLHVEGMPKLANTVYDYVDIEAYDGATDADITDFQYKNASGSWVDGSDFRGAGYAYTANNTANHDVYVRCKLSKNGRYSVKSRLKNGDYWWESITRYYNVQDGQFLTSKYDCYLIEQYKSQTPATYPEKDGKIFVGWYTDNTYSTVSSATSGKAYAKFIDADALTVKAQTDNDAAPTAIRFVSTLDHLDYDDAGFIFSGTYGTNNIAETEKHVTRVYTKIKASGEEMLPSIFSEDSQYFTAYTIRNMDSTASSTWTVKPFLVTPDGTKVIGTEANFAFPR